MITRERWRQGERDSHCCILFYCPFNLHPLNTHSFIRLNTPQVGPRNLVERLYNPYLGLRRIRSHCDKIHVGKNSVPPMAKKEKSKKRSMANFDKWQKKIYSILYLINTKLAKNHKKRRKVTKVKLVFIWKAHSQP